MYDKRENTEQRHIQRERRAADSILSSDFFYSFVREKDSEVMGVSIHIKKGPIHQRQNKRTNSETKNREQQRMRGRS